MSLSESELVSFQELAERQLQPAFSDSQILNLQTRVRFPVALPCFPSVVYELARSSSFSTSRGD